MDTHQKTLGTYAVCFSNDTSLHRQFRERKVERGRGANDGHLITHKTRHVQGLEVAEEVEKK